MTSKPYGQTRAATAGPDVVASSVGFTNSEQISAAALARFAALAHAAGVTAYSGPYPVAWPVLRAHGITADAMAEGRDAAPAVVDQPKIIQGTWVHADGVVIERAFADALGVHLGEHITLDGRAAGVLSVVKGHRAAMARSSSLCTAPASGACCGRAALAGQPCTVRDSLAGWLVAHPQ